MVDTSPRMKENGFMKDEVEISDRYIRCLEDIGKLVYKTSNIFQAIEKEFVRKQNISTSQATLLIRILNTPGGEMSMTRIISEMNLEKSTVTRLIDSIAEKSYVEKRRNSQDRREVAIMLTSEGKKHAASLKEERMEYYRNILKRLPKGKVREVMSSFEMVVDAFDAGMR